MESVENDADVYYSFFSFRFIGNKRLTLYISAVFTVNICNGFYPF